MEGALPSAFAHRADGSRAGALDTAEERAVSGKPPDVAYAEALRALGCTVSEVSRGRVHATCPLAPVRHERGVDRHPSFAVSVDPSVSGQSVGRAHCFSCNASGHIRDIVSLCQAYRIADPRSVAAALASVSDAVETEPLAFQPRRPEDPLAPPGWLDRFPPWRERRFAREYLASRGVTANVADVLDLRAGDWERRVVFPVRDRAGRLRGATGRTLIDPPPRGARYHFYRVGEGDDAGTVRGYTWLGEDSVDPSRPVVVVEGPFDLAAVRAAYDNSVSSLFNNVKAPQSGWHARVPVIVGMFDTGQGGDVARARLRSVVRGTSVRVYDCPIPNGRKDPGECGPAEIYDALRELVDSRLSL